MPLPEGKTPAEKAEIKLWLKDRLKFVSGFCNEINKPGQHEGQSPTDWKGRGMIVCTDIENCPCVCHYRVEQMFKLTGMERRIMQNPAYNPEPSEFVMPDFAVTDPLGDASIRLHTDGPPTPEDGYAPLAAAPTTPLVERRTPLGYAGRGTLEAQVWACMTEHAEVIKLNVPMTTLMTSEWIAERYNVPTPSRGAIQAVWQRWHDIGFAELGKKPVRFVGFKNTGTWQELERIKQSAKQQKKSSQAAAKRGTLRPRA